MILTLRIVFVGLLLASSALAAKAVDTEVAPRHAPKSRPTLANFRFDGHEIDAAPMTAGNWILIACAVDVRRHSILVYQNGKKVAEIELPQDLKLEVVDSKNKNEHKVWTFANYSSGNVFHGTVDELIIYGKAHSEDELATFQAIAPDANAHPGRRRLPQNP